MGGIESYIADLSVSMAQTSAQNAIQTKLLDNTIESSEASAMSLIEDISQLPTAYGNVGGLMDCKG